MLEDIGRTKRKNGHHADPHIPGLEEGISCACGRVLYLLGEVLTKASEGELNYPIAFSSRKLSQLRRIIQQQSVSV